MVSLPTLLNFLAICMLVISVLSIGRMRLASMIWLFALLSGLLGVYAMLVAVSTDELHLIVTAVVTIAIKAIFIPVLLFKTAGRNRAVYRLESIMRPTTQMMIAGLVVGVVFYVTRDLTSAVSGGYIIMSVSIAMLLLGLMLLIVRAGMYEQIIGFFMMENALFIFGLALIGGMPLLVELGIFFDIMIGSVLMAGLSYRAHETHGTVATDRLRELTD